ncbi:RHS repeat-associated core domain-containing protein [Pseudomonas sp. IT-P176]|uniref:RHS repeat-associated core domain-containing protein n=1 Tax=Pseudomonas sp. IT-P176 TaxID=3026444 RepID=UPI0039DFF83A
MGTQQLVILCSYGYDPLDRLISQRQPDASNRQRFYCKSRLATEIQGTIANTIFQKDGLLLAQLQNQNKEITSTLLSTDQQRSVLYTLKAGNQRQPIAYSSYGHHHADSGLTSLLGFNGERPDPVTGHYLLGNGYRAFNPVLMRFNSPDSWSPFGEGGLNCYSYCFGDPINLSDQNGHAPIPPKVIKNLAIIPTKSTPEIIFKSGPETTKEITTYGTFHTQTTKNTRDANGTWQERTYENDRLLKSVHSRNGSTAVHVLGQPSRYYKNNQTLQDLSYSNIHGTTIINLPKLISEAIDPLNNTLNKLTAFGKIIHQHRLHKLSVAAQDRKLDELYKLFDDEIEKGNVMGVHPNHVKKIRERL